MPGNNRCVDFAHEFIYSDKDYFLLKDKVDHLRIECWGGISSFISKGKFVGIINFEYQDSYKLILKYKKLLAFT
jgi:hypothetical protein